MQKRGKLLQTAYQLVCYFRCQNICASAMTTQQIIKQQKNFANNQAKWKNCLQIKLQLQCIAKFSCYTSGQLLEKLGGFTKLLKNNKSKGPLRVGTVLFCTLGGCAMSFAICIACFTIFVIFYNISCTYCNNGCNFYNVSCTNLVIFWGYVVCFCKRRCKNFANYSSSLSLNNLETSSKNALRLE